MRKKRNTTGMRTENYSGKHRIAKNIILAAFCVIFAEFYEYFSHQVYSMYMIGAFLFPVVLGIVPDIIREKTHRKVSTLALALQQCGIYTLVIGSIFRGVLDIYGTTNQAGALYWIVGWGLVIVGGIIIAYKHFPTQP